MKTSTGVGVSCCALGRVHPARTSPNSTIMDSNKAGGDFIIFPSLMVDLKLLIILFRYFLTKYITLIIRDKFL